MAFYLFFQRIKYWLVAKNRHGVHSPFVYTFIEKILNGRWPEKNFNQFPYWKQSGFTSKQSIILDRICSYYDVQTIQLPGNQIEITNSNSGIRLLIYSGLNQIELNNHFSDIVIILNPYSSSVDYSDWRRLTTEPGITLSIDIFEMGIFFFRKEFLVKQHFILK